MGHIDLKARDELLRGDHYERALRAIESLRKYAATAIEYADVHRALESHAGEMDRSDYQQRIEDIDLKRRRAHDSAMDSLKMLNRIAERTGTAPVYVGDLENEERDEIAHAIFAAFMEALEADKHWGSRGEDQA